MGGGTTRGAALVIVLLIMGVLLLLGTAFMTISATETQIASNERNAVQAFYLAEAGLNKTISDLNAGAVCSSLSDVSLGSGTFTRTVNLGASLDERIIESTGYVPNSTSASKAQAMVKVTLKGSLFNMALFGGKDSGTALEIGENSVVDSYDSSQGAYNPSSPGTKAEIGSNSNDSDDAIKLRWNVTVECSAIARGKIKKESGATVTGVEKSYAFSNAVTLPEVVIPPGSGSDVNVPPTTTLPSAPCPAPGSWSYGKLNVAANKTITLCPGTYYFYGDIKIEPNSTLTISPAGQVKIYVTGKLDVKNNVQINAASALPTNLLIYSSFSGSDGVSFGKDLKFFGAIYAPNTNITTQKDSEIFGSLIGKTVDLEEDNKVHFDAALLRLDPCDTTPGWSLSCPYKPYKPKPGTWQEVLPSS